jgi:proteic killer suppression protein
MDVYEVVVSKLAANQLKKIPSHVSLKLQGWIEDVSEFGLREVRKQPGFHDEPLKVRRFGQRSIRLSKAYRAIYEIDKRDKTTYIAEIMEVNKHEY